MSANSSKHKIHTLKQGARDTHGTQSLKIACYAPINVKPAGGGGGQGMGWGFYFVC